MIKLFCTYIAQPGVVPPMSMVSAQQAAGIQPLMSINTTQAQGMYADREI